MVLPVWPTDAGDGSVASEARWRKMARLWSLTGVAAGVGLQLSPTLAFPNLTIQPGAAWVDGHYCESNGAVVLPVTANGLAVVRFDPAANTADLVYVDGATVPVQNATGVFEVAIAKIVGSALTDCRTLVHPLGAYAYSAAGRDVNYPSAPVIGARMHVWDKEVMWDGYRWVPAPGTLIPGILGSGAVAQWATITIANYDFPPCAWARNATLNYTGTVSAGSPQHVQLKAWNAGGGGIMSHEIQMPINTDSNNGVVDWSLPVLVGVGGGRCSITASALSAGGFTFWGDPAIDAAWAVIY